MRKLAILMSAAAVAAMLGGGQALAQTTWVVNDGAPDADPCDDTPDFTVIQDAVDAASAIPGDTVMVCPGTYLEQLTVATNNLSLVSAIPQDAIIDGTGMAADDAVIHVDGATGVSIRDFRITGPTTGGAIGIFVSGNGDATIDGNEIDGFVQGIWVGRHLWSAVGTATITNNEITGYHKGGVVVDNAGSDATIAENLIVGAGSTPIVAQNGIQVSRWATAEVKRNTVNGNWFSGSNWTAIGILVFETQDVMVQRNEVNNNLTGVGIEAWAWIGPDANDNRVIKNTITGSPWGVTVTAFEFCFDEPLGDDFTFCPTSGDVAANNNKITNNVIVAPDPGDEAGISVGAISIGAIDTVYVPTAVNNKIINNKIIGYTTPIDTSGDAATKEHANVID